MIHRAMRTINGWDGAVINARSIRKSAMKLSARLSSTDCRPPNGRYDCNAKTFLPFTRRVHELCNCDLKCGE